MPGDPKEDPSSGDNPSVGDGVRQNVLVDTVRWPRMMVYGSGPSPGSNPKLRITKPVEAEGISKFIKENVEWSQTKSRPRMKIGY